MKKFFNRYAVIFFTLTAYLILYRGLWKIGFPDFYASAAGCALVYLVVRLTRSELTLKPTGKKMTFSVFLTLLGLSFLAQTLRIPFNKLFELGLNAFGRSLYTAPDATQARVLFTDSFAHLTTSLWPILLGPIVEELLYRVFAAGSMKNGGGKVLAILFSAIAFSLAHGKMDYFVHTFVSGLVFGYLFFEYGFKWAAIFHVINNFGIMGLELIFSIVWGDQTGSYVCNRLGLLFAVFAIVMVVIKRKEVTAYVKENAAPRGEYGKAFLNAGFFVMLAYDLYKCITYIAPVA